MKFNVKIKKEDSRVNLPVDNHRFITFHITKHIFKNHKNERIADLIRIPYKKILEVLDYQKNQFKCKIKKTDITNEETCKKCEYSLKCYEYLNSTLSIKLDNFYRLIRDGMLNDHLFPRHLLYFDVKKNNKRIILFIDQYGLNIIGEYRQYKDDSPYIRIKTCYRGSISHLNKMNLKFNNHLNDSRFRVHDSIQKWKLKVQKKNYRQPRFYEKRNWMWV